MIKEINENVILGCIQEAAYSNAFYAVLIKKDERLYVNHWIDAGTRLVLHITRAEELGIKAYEVKKAISIGEVEGTRDAKESLMVL